MKTRNELYSREAAELLRVITTYKSVTFAQVLRLFPGKDEKIRAILTHLIRQGRVTHGADGVLTAADGAPDAEMYEIVYVRYGQEALVSHALNGGDPPRRIVIVEDTAVRRLLRTYLQPRAVGQTDSGLRQSGAKAYPRHYYGVLRRRRYGASLRRVQHDGARRTRFSPCTIPAIR
jgi:hypothetical protein